MENKKKGGARLKPGKSSFDPKYTGDRVAPQKKDVLIDTVVYLINKYNIDINDPNFGKNTLSFLLTFAMLLTAGGCVLKEAFSLMDRVFFKDDAPTFSAVEPMAIDMVLPDYREITIDMIRFSASYKEALDNMSLSDKINYLLDHMNLTYEDLFRLASNSSTYQDEFNDILAKYPSLTDESIVNILNGASMNIHDTLYIGDSRMQGMLQSGAITNENTIYGVGYGYNWFVGSGDFNSDKTNAPAGVLRLANSKLQNGASTNIVLWLGVNDYRYRNAETYFNKYAELATGEWQNHDLFVVSVGPVKDSSANSVDNNGINAFNAKMAELISASGIPNLHFINLNYREDSIIRYDGSGLHYGGDDYRRIQGIIEGEVKNYNSPECEQLRNLLYQVLVDHQELLNKIDNVPSIILGRFQK